MASIRMIVYIYVYRELNYEGDIQDTNEIFCGIKEVNI